MRHSEELLSSLASSVLETNNTKPQLPFSIIPPPVKCETTEYSEPNQGLQLVEPIPVVTETMEVDGDKQAAGTNPSVLQSGPLCLQKEFARASPKCNLEELSNICSSLIQKREPLDLHDHDSTEPLNLHSNSKDAKDEPLPLYTECLPLQVVVAEADEVANTCHEEGSSEEPVSNIPSRDVLPVGRNNYKLSVTFFYYPINYLKLNLKQQT